MTSIPCLICTFQCCSGISPPSCAPSIAIPVRLGRWASRYRIRPSPFASEKNDKFINQFSIRKFRINATVNYQFRSNPFGAFTQETKVLVGFKESRFERRTRRPVGIRRRQRRQHFQQPRLEHGADGQPALMDPLDALVQIGRLHIAAIFKELDVGEHGLDGLFDSDQFGVDGVAIVHGVARMEPIQPLGFFIDAEFNFIQPRIRLFRFAVNFFCDPLEPFESLHFFVDGNVAFLVQSHQLIPVALQHVGPQFRLQFLFRLFQKFLFKY